MDTLVIDPFFQGFERDLFGLDGGVKELFEIKDQDSFVAFECGHISEDEHFRTYFNDRRPVEGASIRAYLRQRYAWCPGMLELCQELKGHGVALATCSNYPAEWASLIEDALGLSDLVPWAFISGEVGVRKPAWEAFEAALTIVDRSADEVVFVDDSVTNVAAAEKFGIRSIHFNGAKALRPILFDVLGLPMPKAAL